MSTVKQTFDRDGFVVVPGFLVARQLAELQEQLGRYMKEVMPTLPSGSVLYEDKTRPETLKQLPLKTEIDAYFADLLNRGRFRELAEELLGGSVVPKNLQWLNKPPLVGKDTPPHQDGYYYMLEPSEAVALWLALDQADEENGCMRYVLGSHLRSMRPHSRTKTLGFSQGITDFEEADRKPEVAISTKPGDLLVHHCLTIHRADANQSTRNRRAMQWVYFSTRAKEDSKRKAEYQAQLKADLAKEGKI
jgi:phytanoyl-CoA hydroxylase